MLGPTDAGIGEMNALSHNNRNGIIAVGGAINEAIVHRGQRTQIMASHCHARRGTHMYATVIAFILTVSLSGVAFAEELVCNDEWSIKRSSMQSQAFTLKKALSVVIDISPVKHADKGVSIHLVPASLWEDYKVGHATLKAIRDANTVLARSVHHVVNLNAGMWVVAVENSENLFEPAVVRVKITINSVPDPAAPESANPVPTSVGQCVDTLVQKVEENGTGILYSNGVLGSTYDSVPGVAASKIGDPIHLWHSCGGA
jgi:hypothetical protein